MITMPPTRSGARRRRPPLFAALATILILVAACASGGENEGPQIPFATLVVENDNTSTVTVYAVRGGTRQRMGTVTGLATERFEIRRSMLTGGGELSVAIDPLGSRRVYRAMPIFVNQGDVIEVTVSSFLR